MDACTIAVCVRTSGSPTVSPPLATRLGWTSVPRPAHASVWHTGYLVIGRHTVVWVHRSAMTGGRVEGRRMLAASECASLSGRVLSGAALLALGVRRSRHLGSGRCHGAQVLSVDLTPEQGTIDVARLVERTQLQLRHQASNAILGFVIRIGPTVKVLEAFHPLLRIEDRNKSQVVGNSADFFSEENRYRGDGRLDVDAIPLQLLDGFREELVIMNQRPQVS